MANVNFKFGTKEKYVELPIKDPNTLYWLTDTQEVYKGDILFGIGAEATEEVAGLLSPEDKKTLTKLLESGIMDLTPVDGSISITTVDGVKKIGVAISENADNIISLKDDGIFVSASEINDVLEYSIEKLDASTDGFSATYRLKKTIGEVSEFIGDSINIPKDLVLQSGSFEVVTETNTPYVGAEIGDPYIDLVLNDPSNSHIYIPLKGVVDTVIAGQGVSVEDNTVSVRLDSDSSNGLTLSNDGLALNLATEEFAGAMSPTDKKFIKAIPDLYDEVKYEFFNLLDGTRVNHLGKEHRIMFPVDAKWTKQSGDKTNPNYKENNYYFAMRAYAPNDKVVGFKEAMKKVVDDNKLYHFIASDFGGVDEYGRKYSVIWLPAAKYDDTKGWTYHGTQSGDGKYIGWDYSVEWYDENENVVASDTIRINLTNEDCHNSTVPFYMVNYATTDDIKSLQENLVWGEL